MSKALHAVESLTAKSAHGVKDTAIGVKNKAVGAKHRVKDKAMEGRTPVRRSLKGSDAELEGFLYRETSVQGLVNGRYGALLPTHFVTYRKADGGQPPTKAWALEEGCYVTPIQKAEFMIRNKGTSTMWALARGHYTKADLYSFTLAFPPGHVHFRDPLKLCFDDEAAAKSWQASIVRNIKQQSQATQSVTYDEIVHEIGIEGNVPEDREPLEAAQSNTHIQVTAEDPSQTEESLIDPFAPPRDSEVFPKGSKGQSLAEGKLASIRHVNGVAVYEEPSSSDQEPGAFMVSAVVRTTPREVFKSVASLGKALPLGFEMEVLESLGERSRVVRRNLSPSWLSKMFCAPREVVMQQSWREEEDGTIVVLAHSVEHEQAPISQPAWSWYNPVRTQTKSVGFTLAPLKPRHVPSGRESPECLVTLVLQMDLGGWLSHRSWLSTLLPFWVSRLINSFMEPLLMSICAVRDQVEQSRFVVQPFQLVQQKEETPPESSSGPPVLSSMSSTHFKPLKSGRFSTPQPSRATSVETDEQVAQVETIQESPEEVDPVEEMRKKATLDPQYWSCPGAVNFQVRGKNYLKDRKKVKAEEPVFSLACVDLIEFSRQPFHIAPHLPSIQSSQAPFSFVMNLMVPGPRNLALVITWAAEQDPHPLQVESSTPSIEKDSGTSIADSDSELGTSPFDILLARFMAGDDAEATARRDSMFKLIPSIIKGSWVIKQSVGHTPVILGRKLKTHYHRGPGYFEVDVDVGSSRAASSVVGMVQGATTGIVIDMAVVLEGHSPEELPECLLGTVRLSHLDMKAATVLKEGPKAASGRQTRPHTPRGSMSGQ